MKINRSLFRLPGINRVHASKMLSLHLVASHTQLEAATLAATLADGGVVTDEGNCTDVEVINSSIAGAGESMVIDVTKNGTSILSGTYTINTASGKGKISLDGLLLANTTFAAGDIIRVVRTYTAGGSPAMTATKVITRWAPGGAADEVS